MKLRNIRAAGKPPILALGSLQPGFLPAHDVCVYHQGSAITTTGSPAASAARDQADEEFKSGPRPAGPRACTGSKAMHSSTASSSVAGLQQDGPASSRQAVKAQPFGAREDGGVHADDPCTSRPAVAPVPEYGPGCASTRSGSTSADANHAPAAEPEPPVTSGSERGPGGASQHSAPQLRGCCSSQSRHQPALQDSPACCPGLTDDELAQLDPRSAKRIVANRQVCEVCIPGAACP